MKAAGNVSLFRGVAAQDFWNLAAHVDAFGLEHLTSWRCQADRAGSNGGKEETADTIARYRAMVAWWAKHCPKWQGQGTQPVADKVNTVAHVLTLLLGNETDLRAYAGVIGEKTLPSSGSSFFDRELTHKTQKLVQERQELLWRGSEWELPMQQPEATRFFLKTIEERSAAITGNTTRIYRRGVDGVVKEGKG